MYNAIIDISPTCSTYPNLIAQTVRRRHTRWKRATSNIAREKSSAGDDTWSRNRARPTGETRGDFATRVCYYVLQSSRGEPSRGARFLIDKNKRQQNVSGPALPADSGWTALNPERGFFFKTIRPMIILDGFSVSTAVGTLHYELGG